MKLILLLAILPLLLITVFNIEVDGQQPHSLQVAVTKISYLPGDTVLVLGNTNVHTLVTLTLISPNGIELEVKETFSNNDARFNSSFNIPSTPDSGIYIIRASDSFSNAETEVCVGSCLNSAPTTSLTITTDKPSYIAGELIQISGEFPTHQNPTSLNISLQSPTHGFLDTMYNVTTNNNSYVTSMSTGNNTSISTSGSYTLTANYGTNTASTTFDYYSHPLESDNESFIPDNSYLILSDQQITKWNNKIIQWENAQNRTDTKIERLYDKLDRAISRNQTDKIETYTQSIGHSMALSSLYDGIIQCLQEQIELLS